jgi:hypothetical protein
VIERLLMEVEVVATPRSAKTVLRRLVEFHAHDSSEFDGKDLDEHGEFGYQFFDHYWTEWAPSSVLDPGRRSRRRIRVRE